MTPEQIIQMGPGLFIDRDNEDVVYFDPVATLQAKGLPAASELEAALFAVTAQSYAKIGKEVILISNDHSLPIVEVIKQAAENQAQAENIINGEYETVEDTETKNEESDNADT